MAPVPTTLICLALSVLLVGCGGSDEPASQQKPQPSVSGDQRGVLETIDALQTASRKGDGRTICSEIFTPQLVRSVERAADRSCAVEVREKLFAPDAEISVGRDVKVDGGQAIAVIREQNGHVSKLIMVKRGDRWQIDRVQPQPA